MYWEYSLYSVNTLLTFMFIEPIYWANVVTLTSAVTIWTDHSCHCPLKKEREPRPITSSIRLKKWKLSGSEPFVPFWLQATIKLLQRFLIRSMVRWIPASFTCFEQPVVGAFWIRSDWKVIPIEPHRISLYWLRCLNKASRTLGSK